MPTSVEEVAPNIAPRFPGEGFTAHDQHARVADLDPVVEVEAAGQAGVDRRGRRRRRGEHVHCLEVGLSGFVADGATVVGARRGGGIGETAGGIRRGARCGEGWGSVEASSEEAGGREDGGCSVAALDGDGCCGGGSGVEAVTEGRSEVFSISMDWLW